MKGQDGLAGHAATHAAAGHRRAYFAGVPGKYLLGSVIDAGLDPDRWVCPTTLAGRGAQRSAALSQLTFERRWACQ
jgi:hypothetical protein